MQRTTIKSIYASAKDFADQKITVGGWARSIRASNAFGFIELNDGTIIESTTNSFTLRSLVEQIAASAQSFTAEQLAAVKAMLAPFDTITSKWNIEGLN